MSDPGRPRFGFTRHGQAVHATATDHLPAGNAVARLNKAVAVKVSGAVGTMWCAYAFCLISLFSLPATLTLAKVVPPHFFPRWLVSVGLIALVAWVAQTFIQLVLLSVIMVGQNVASGASDARAGKTFEDVERVVDLLRLDTEGGLKDLYDKLAARQDEVLSDLASGVLTAPRETVTPTARARRTAGKKAP
jgi:hypothetical protein